MGNGRLRLGIGRRFRGCLFLRLCGRHTLHADKSPHRPKLVQFLFQPVLNVLQIVHISGFRWGEDAAALHTLHITIVQTRNVLQIGLDLLIFRVGLFIHHCPVEGGIVLRQITPLDFFIGILPLQIAEHLSGDPLTAVILQHLYHADMGPSLENTVPESAHCQFSTDGLHEHINLAVVGAQCIIQYPCFLQPLCDGFRHWFRGRHAAGVGVDSF